MGAATRARAVLVAAAIVAAGCSSSGGLATIVEVRQEEPRILAVNVDTCNVELAVSVDESPERVRIAVSKEGDPSGGDCADGIYVALSRPLGDREVIDASNEKTVEVHGAR